MGFDSPPRSPHEAGFNTMSTNYRKYKKGDTVRVTGFQGRLFSSAGEKKLGEDVSLGVECVLNGDEDYEFDVRLPEGILADGSVFISVACIELVEAVEDKQKGAILEHIDWGEHSQLYKVKTPDNEYVIAKIWYYHLPKDVAEKFAHAIKAAYDAIIK